MKSAYLTVGDRRFYLPPEEVDNVMLDAVAARDRGEWLDFHDAGGRRLRILIPPQELLLLQEYEVPEPEGDAADPNDWSNFDYDI